MSKLCQRYISLILAWLHNSFSFIVLLKDIFPTWSRWDRTLHNTRGFRFMFPTFPHSSIICICVSWGGESFERQTLLLCSSKMWSCYLPLQDCHTGLIMLALYWGAILEGQLWGQRDKKVCFTFSVVTGVPLGSPECHWRSLKIWGGGWI